MSCFSSKTHPNVPLFVFFSNVYLSGFTEAARLVDFAAELEPCGSLRSASTLACAVSAVSVSRGTTAARSTRRLSDR